MPGLPCPPAPVGQQPNTDYLASCEIYQPAESGAPSASGETPGPQPVDRTASGALSSGKIQGQCCRGGDRSRNPMRAPQHRIVITRLRRETLHRHRPPRIRRQTPDRRRLSTGPMGPGMRCFLRPQQRPADSACRQWRMDRTSTHQSMTPATSAALALGQTSDPTTPVSLEAELYQVVA